VGAGLAGGSSNAASVLLGLNKIWRLKLSQQRLAGYAKAIGADVAFFLYNTAFAIGSGRGDEIKPLRLQIVKKFWHILVVPRIEVSTPWIYKKWDEATNLELTKPRCNVNMLYLALRKGNASLMAKHLFNSLQEVSIRLYPEVKCIKEKLAMFGLKAILMSGSGPAVFGIVTSRKEAVALGRKIRQENRSWRVFVARTV